MSHQKLLPLFPKYSQALFTSKPLQEHWLLPDELSYLSAVDTNFVAFGSSAVDITTNMLAGRLYGGTARAYCVIRI